MKYSKRREFKYSVEGVEVFKFSEPTPTETTALIRLSDSLIRNGQQNLIRSSSGPFYLNLNIPELVIQNGYAWDGVSAGINTKTNKRGSLAHDALYQLIREGLLPLELKDWADRSFRKICLEDGMSRLRAWYSYQAVKRFGLSSCDPAKHILTAP